jgi:hypothetical protein
VLPASGTANFTTVTSISIDFCRDERRVFSMGDQIINIFNSDSGKNKPREAEKTTYEVDGWRVRGLEKGLSQDYVEMLMMPFLKKLESNGY